MLEKLFLDVGGPCSSAGTSAVENALERNSRTKTVIKNHCHFLPQNLHKHNTLEVYITFWYQDSCFTGDLLLQNTFFEHLLDKVH